MVSFVRKTEKNYPGDNNEYLLIFLTSRKASLKNPSPQRKLWWSSGLFDVGLYYRCILFNWSFCEIGDVLEYWKLHLNTATWMDVLFQNLHETFDFE